MKKKWMLAAAAAVIALVLAGLALAPMGKQETPVSARMETARIYQMEMDSRLSQLLLGKVAGKKLYMISDTATAAPVPDQSRYGQTDSPEELGRILEEAGELLEGQKLYFSPDVPLCPETEVQYYLDETILVITWKQVIRNTVFTFSEIKVAHPSQFRRHLSGGFGSWNRERTSDMAKGVNAVVAFSGDYYDHRQVGLTITNGTVQKYYPGDRGTLDTCLIDRNGDMFLEPGIVFTGVQDAQAYADAHDTNFSLSFGPALVKDGVLLHTGDYPVGELSVDFPRAAICQMDQLHYLGMVCNKDTYGSELLNMENFAQCVYETGCRQAYALDGGQTATVVMNGAVFNNVNYGSERPISDIIYFATAKPAGE